MNNLTCEGCSIEHNRSLWNKYPDILDICKKCKSFQEGINQMVEEYIKLNNKINLSTEVFKDTFCKDCGSSTENSKE